MRLQRRRKFLEDLAEAYAYLADENPAVAESLLDQVEATVELLMAFPAAGRPRDDLRAGVRSLRLRRFPHVIFYRRTNDAVILQRILHGARNIVRGMMERPQAAWDRAT